MESPGNIRFDPDESRRLNEAQFYIDQGRLIDLTGLRPDELEILSVETVQDILMIDTAYKKAKPKKQGN